MDKNIELPKEVEFIRPYLDLMENAISSVSQDYGMQDLVQLAVDKNVIIGDSDGLEGFPHKAIILLPATENKPAGKYIDLAPLRESLNRLPFTRMQDIIKFVNEYEFTQDVSGNELIKIIVANFNETN